MKPPQIPGSCRQTTGANRAVGTGVSTDFYRNCSSEHRKIPGFLDSTRKHSCVLANSPEADKIAKNAGISRAFGV